MNYKIRRIIAVITIFFTVFACAGTFSSEAASKPGRVKSFHVKVSGRNVKLSWSKASGKVSRYVIYRNGKKIASVSCKTLKYTDKGRKYGKTYSYKVRAYRKRNGSRVYGKWSVTGKAVIRPGRVSGLECTGNSSDQISLSWNKVPGASGYAVYRGGKLVARTKSTSYTDTGLLHDSMYEYYIKSYVKNGSKYVYGKASEPLKAVTASLTSEENTLLDIYCAQTARDRVSPEGLETFIDLVRGKLQPQAVDLLLTKFPGMKEAAYQGDIGNDLPLYIYYMSGDKDGCILHEKAESSVLKLMGAVGQHDDEDFFTYLLTVDISPFCKRGLNGVMQIKGESESVELLKDRLTGEMLRALMFDFNRTGMIGAVNLEDAAVDDEGRFPTEEKYEMYRQTVFPKWFTEGTVSSVENVFRNERDQFALLAGSGNNDLLNNYVSQGNGFDLESNVLTCVSEESCSVSGYLAVLYLAELMSAKENASSIDDNGSVSADRLRHGLDRILTRLHDGEETLDDVIKDISPCVSENVKLYSDTEAFEQLFIKGRKDGSGQYAGDRASMVFVSTLLDYLKSCKGSSERDLPGGSILTDLNQSRSPIDENKEHASDFLHIIESKEPAKSTVRSESSLIGGGRSR